MADVRYGQIWKDNDTRYVGGRFVKVMEVNAGFAVIIRVNEDGSSYFSSGNPGKPAKRSRKALRCFGIGGATGMTFVREPS